MRGLKINSARGGIYPKKKKKSWKYQKTAET